ncbi:MAG: rRNA ((1402)-2-O)-methyltransferase [Pseudomonadota bacterium]
MSFLSLPLSPRLLPVSLDTIVSPLILQAASAAAGHQQHPASALYVVATPIGNMADMSLRAIHVLSLVDAVACEDTRVSAGLLQRLGLHRPLIALHEHNEESAAPLVIERLARGERVAYVSDAGTPAISDPGARLVAAVRAAGFRVVPLPGASSVVTALSAAGDVAGGGFRFVGFVSPKAAARGQDLRQLGADPGTCVLFEAPHRIEALADALAEVLPARRLTVCRELTKQFEDIHTLDCTAFPAWLAADADHRRGEFVLVLHARGASEAAPADADTVSTDHLLRTLMAELPLKQAVSLTAQVTGGARNALYEQALELRHQAGNAHETPESRGHAAPIDLPPTRLPDRRGRVRR